MKYIVVFALALMLFSPVEASAKSKKKSAPVCGVVKTQSYKWYPKNCVKSAPLRSTNA